MTPYAGLNLSQCMHAITGTCAITRCQLREQWWKSESLSGLTFSVICHFVFTFTEVHLRSFLVCRWLKWKRAMWLHLTISTRQVLSSSLLSFWGGILEYWALALKSSLEFNAAREALDRYSSCVYLPLTSYVSWSLIIWASKLGNFQSCSLLPVCRHEHRVSVAFCAATGESEI